MPSFQHEVLLQLFRNRPLLAAELLRDALHETLPTFTQARLESAELTDIQPAEYRADLVVLLLHGQAVLGIIVEAQLARDDAKRYVWPAYVVNLRARIKCPVWLLVVAAEESVARWAASPIDLGGHQRFTPTVLGPAAIPKITDPAAARQHPELAVFSVIAHGRSAEPDTSAQIALAAIAGCAGLDADRTTLYVDLIYHFVSEAARRALGTMKPANYELQSDFARHFFSLGKADGKTEGKAEGKAELLLKLATLKFGPLPDTVRQEICAASDVQLEHMAERLLKARTPGEMLMHDPPP
jgi:hypothetical protein